MRYCTFDQDGPRVGLLRGDTFILDVQAIDADLAGDLLHVASDAEAAHRLDRVARGQPAPGTLRPVARARFLPPVPSSRVVLGGGQSEDLRDPELVSPAGTLTGTAWSTGVGAVLRHRAGDLAADTWRDHVLGFTLLHVAAGADGGGPRQVCMGPWIVALDEVMDERKLAFSAFVDDVPRVRPAKALFDWGGEMVKANGARTLRGGDILAIATPPMEASGSLRSALVYDGKVLARLQATLVADGGGTKEPGGGAATLERGPPSAPASP